MSSILPVVESFHSVQGEGAHSGRSAFFIRLAGCKVGCYWCDTKHSWLENKHPQQCVQRLAEEAAKARSKGAAFVVITGGEPLHHNLDTLCRAIRTVTNAENGHEMPIHIETSGVDSLSGAPNWITLSPKPHAPPRAELLSSCQEIKVIVHTKSDLSFAEEIAKQTLKEQNRISNIKESKQPFFFLQPGWNSQEGHKLTVEYVIHHPQWRLSMQTHKLLGIR